MTHDFSGSTFRVKKWAEGTLVTITELVFDAELKVITFLANGNKYQLYLDNGDEVRNIGDLYVDSSDLEKTITVGGVTALNMSVANVSFTPPTWDNVSSIYMYWNESGGRINQIDFWVYNYSNRSHLLYYASCTNASACSFSYTVPDTNQNYWTKYRIHHDYYGNNTFGGGLPIILTLIKPDYVFPLIFLITQLGSTASEMWFYLLFIIAIPMFFTKKSSGAAAFATLGFVTLLHVWGQFEIQVTVLGLGLFVALLIEIQSRKNSGGAT